MVTETGWQLGAVVFLPHQRLLCRHQQQVYLEPKVFLLLEALLQAEQQLLEHPQMLSRVWQGRVVSDSAIHRATSLLRKAFAELDPSQTYLETLPKVGYRLVVPVAPYSPELAMPLAVEEKLTDLQPKADIADPPPQRSQSRYRIGKAGDLATGGFWFFSLMVLLGLSWWFLATEGRPPSELRQESLANAVADASQFGPAQVMTADDGMEFQLSVDQQGQQFVYLQQRQGAKPQWWLQQADGSRSALTFAEPEVRQVVLSPDAQSVVYQGCQLQRGVQQCQLLWRPVTRLQADMLLSYPDDSALQLSWQPDGQAIFFRMRDHKSLPYQIYRYSLATKQLQPLTLPPAGQSDIALTIDPMGQQLVVLRYEQQQQRQLLWYRLPDLTLFNQQSVPVAATVVAFDHQQRLWLDCPDGIGSRLCRWQAKDAILTAELAVPGAVLSLMVAGEQLWFSAGQQRSQIWRQQLPLQIEPNPNAPASLATKATVEVSSTRLELMPRVFEQDLVFLSNRHGRHQIWRRQADGSSAVLAELPAPAGFVRLSRSDDGQYLAFSHHGALYLLHLQSAMCWPLLGSTEKVGVVNWHQHQLIFSSERSGDWQLWRYLDPLSKAVGAKHHGGKPGQCVAAEPETTLATTEADLQQLTQQGAYSGAVWRNQLLYSKYHQDGLFQLELDQPEPTEQLVLADFDRINWLNWQLIGDNLSYFQPGQGVLTRPLQLTTADKVQVGAATLVFPQQSGFIHQYQRTEQAIWWVQSTEQQADVLRLSLKD